MNYDELADRENEAAPELNAMQEVQITKDKIATQTAMLKMTLLRTPSDSALRENLEKYTHRLPQPNDEDTQAEITAEIASLGDNAVDPMEGLAITACTTSVEKFERDYIKGITKCHTKALKAVDSGDNKALAEASEELQNTIGSFHRKSKVRFNRVQKDGAPITNELATRIGQYSGVVEMKFPLPTKGAPSKPEGTTRKPPASKNDRA